MAYQATTGRFVGRTEELARLRELLARAADGEPLVALVGGEAADRLGLTRREAEVLALVASGRSNGQIAQALFISPKTASVHVSNILAKLGVRTRVEAAAVTHRLGLD
jgi:DNA-binding CsgD family transcriptional regulator